MMMRRTSFGSANLSGAAFALFAHVIEQAVNSFYGPLCLLDEQFQEAVLRPPKQVFEEAFDYPLVLNDFFSFRITFQDGTSQPVINQHP
jgi:hypothetical protein